LRGILIAIGNLSAFVLEFFQLFLFPFRVEIVKDLDGHTSEIPIHLFKIREVKKSEYNRMTIAIEGEVR